MILLVYDMFQDMSSSSNLPHGHFWHRWIPHGKSIARPFGLQQIPRGRIEGAIDLLFPLLLLLETEMRSSVGGMLRKKHELNLYIDHKPYSII